MVSSQLPDGGRPGRGWVGNLALGFVLATLVILVVVPVVETRQVAAKRQQISASAPAPTLVRQLELTIVRAMLILDKRLVAPGQELPEAYAQARNDERIIYARLDSAAAHLGPDVQQAVEQTRIVTETWHARVTDPAIYERHGAGGLLDSPSERAEFQQVLDAITRLDNAVLQRTASVRAEIAALERSARRLTALLSTLALLAGAVAAVLWNRSRRLALDAAAGRRDALRQRTEAERRRIESERASLDAARAQEARARLLRGVTHDVKNPLGAARGYADLLAMEVKAPLHPEQQPLVDGIRRSIDSAISIIDDLLDLARAESGGLRIERVNTDLAAVVADAIATHEAAAQAAGHTIEMDVPEPIRIRTDPIRVRQILDNLLSNAIKYTPPPGRITVRASNVNEGPMGPHAEISVSDTGPGIPKPLREWIFDEFARLGPESGLEGHGLGLAIARRIARLLGGELAVTDTDRPGATLVLTLPHETPRSPDGWQPREPARPQRAWRRRAS